MFTQISATLMLFIRQIAAIGVHPDTNSTILLRPRSHRPPIAAFINTLTLNKIAHDKVSNKSKFTRQVLLAPTLSHLMMTPHTCHRKQCIYRRYSNLICVYTHFNSSSATLIIGLSMVVWSSFVLPSHAQIRGCIALVMAVPVFPLPCLTPCSTP